MNKGTPEVRVTLLRQPGTEEVQLAALAQCNGQAKTYRTTLEATPVGVVQAVDRVNDWLAVVTAGRKSLTMTHLARHWVAVPEAAALPIVSWGSYSLRFAGVEEGSLWYWVEDGGRVMPWLLIPGGATPETATKLLELVRDTLPPTTGPRAYQGSAQLLDRTTREVVRTLERAASPASGRATGRVPIGRYH